MRLIDKEFFALFFYFILSGFSFFAAGEMKIAQIAAGSMSNSFNTFSIYFVLVRSAITFILTALISKMDREEILAKQITDEQISKKELILMLGLATAIYVYLRLSHSFIPSVVLAYFYTTTLVLFFRHRPGIIIHN